jgi:hypothetical protein
MLTNEIKVNHFLLQYCRVLTDDIAEDRMADQPLPCINHPAWILGHIAFSADVAVGLLGGEKTLPADWLELFKPGSTLRTARSDYASKTDLLHAVEQYFRRARDLAATAASEQLARPSTNPRMKEALPTIKDALSFLFTGHLGVHLGQLSSWRRMIGLPPLF